MKYTDSRIAFLIAFATFSVILVIFTNLDKLKWMIVGLGSGLLIPILLNFVQGKPKRYYTIAIFLVTISLIFLADPLASVIFLITFATISFLIYS